MFHSSIFSSEAPRAKRRRRAPRALLLATAILAVVELGAARREWLWSRDRSSASGIIDGMEELVIAPSAGPSLLFMGSSRARDALVPRQLEDRLSLPRGSVLNLGLTAGTPFDALIVYRRNRAKLSSARTLVFAIEDWHLNERFPTGVLDRRFATLSERIGVFDQQGTTSLVAGWVWRTYDAQEPLQDFLTSLAGSNPRSLRVSEDGRIIYRDHEMDEGPERTDVDIWAEHFYRPFALGGGRLGQLRALIDLAREDGMRVIVVRLPWRDAYVDEVTRRFPREFLETTRLSGEIAGAEVILYERASALGVSDRSFYDYGHLTPPGAKIMTDRIADVVLAARPDASPKESRVDPH